MQESLFKFSLIQNLLILEPASQILIVKEIIQKWIVMGNPFAVLLYPCRILSCPWLDTDGANDTGSEYWIRRPETSQSFCLNKSIISPELNLAKPVKIPGPCEGIIPRELQTVLNESWNSSLTNSSACQVETRKQKIFLLQIFFGSWHGVTSVCVQNCHECVI